ncbi:MULTISPECIES: hypothetical protein [unclassified Bradyrhizobium]|uniref:hypothetical protein n=1 Tax=unclassified Bradyrhizobium TaxID=2631580 RepID=UPI002915C4A1|nr:MULTISPECIES: hypothetical protein [unclassified Bradyrhizobium]
MSREHRRFFLDLKENRSMQEEVASGPPDAEAIAVYAAARGYAIDVSEIEANIGAILWIARVGEDIDHA